MCDDVAGVAPELDIGLSSHTVSHSGTMADFFGVDYLPPSELGMWVPSITVRSDDVGRIRIGSFADRSGGEAARASAARARAGRLPYTMGLTPLARRTLEGAGLKAVSIGSPMVSMYTFTVDDEHLPALSPVGETPPAELLGTHLDRALKWLRMYCQRHELGKPEYLWVAESSSRGIRAYNPHIHFLTSVRIPESDFLAFKTALTASWGQGNVTCEFLRNPSSAGFYCTKNYLTKDGKRGGSSGVVYGKRWNCSRGIRPVETRSVVPSSDADAMLLREITKILGESSRRIEFDGARVNGGGLFPPAGSSPADWLKRLPGIYSVVIGGLP